MLSSACRSPARVGDAEIGDVAGVDDVEHRVLVALHRRPDPARHQATLPGLKDQPFPGRGNDDSSTLSHPESGRTELRPISTRADAVTLYRAFGRFAASAFSIVSATASGGPASFASGPFL